MAERAYMAGEHAWQWGMHGRGMHGRGACMAGGMHGMHVPPVDRILDTYL